MILRHLLLILLLAACAKEAVNPRSILTRELIDNFGKPILLAEVPELEVGATLTIAGVNADTITWVTGDQVGLSLKNGFIVATRGLGFDLLIADTSESAAAIRSGSKESNTYVKKVSFLSGQNEVLSEDLNCSMTPPQKTDLTIYQVVYEATQHEEICSIRNDVITNTYWVDKDKSILKSKQWINYETGYVYLERLNR